MTARPDIYSLSDNSNKQMMQAMIFAAGLGTRLRPLTDTRPKALVPVGGRTLLEHTLMRLKAAGADRVVVNVHHFASQITDFLSANAGFGMDIRVSDETDMLLDTGGGIKAAAGLFDPSSPILIHNVDILSNVDLTAFYAANAANDATLLVSGRSTTRYLLFDDGMRLVGWTNTATGEVRSPYPAEVTSSARRYAFSGIHLFSPRLFPLFDMFPDKFGIIDFYLSVCDKVAIRGCADDGLRLMDVGKLGMLAEAEEFVRSVPYYSD